MGKTITDSIIQVGSKLYHIECQSTKDSTMIVRMIEYDFAIALEQTLLNGKPYEMDFPNSCVLYLRETEFTPDELELKVNLPQGGSFLYKTPIIKVQQYKRDIIFQKKLLFFLPYYIMRYEKQLPDIYGNMQKLNMLLEEYEEIRKGLEAELYDEGKSVLYEDLIKLIVLISDYIIKSQEIRERLGAVMGGKVLELESERLLRIGREEGLEKGREEGTLTTMIAMYRSGKVTLEEASEFLGMSVEEFSMKEKAFV